MSTNQIYIKHLFILKLILALFGFSLIVICVRFTFNSNTNRNISTIVYKEKAILKNKVHPLKSDQDSIIGGSKK